MAELMRKYRQETDELRAVPQVKGFRLELPYLARTGAAAKDCLADITPKTTNMLLDAGGGHVKIGDVSPELPGAPDLIRFLSGQGVVCSIAHTEASVEQGRAAVEAGARLVTHAFNVFFPPPDPHTGIYPASVLDYLLVEDRVAFELIPDGTHVPALFVEMAFRCKGPSRIAFVTDSTGFAGLTPGRYPRKDGRGHMVVKSPNDGVMLEGVGLFGSALSPLDGFLNAVRLFGRDIPTACRVCSHTPASFMGLRSGRIAAGRDADLIALDDSLELLFTIAAGRVVYQQPDA